MKKNSTLFLLVGILAVAAAGGYWYVSNMGNHLNISDPFAQDDSAIDSGFSFAEPAPNKNVPPAKQESSKSDTFSLNIEDIKQPTRPVEQKQVETPKSAPSQATPAAAANEDIVRLKAEVASLTKVVMGQGKSLSDLQAAFDKYKNEQDAKAIKPEKRENVGILTRLTPTEQVYAEKLLPLLPPKIVPGGSLSVQSAYGTLQTGGIDELLRTFVQLSASGHKVYMCVGNPSPRNRPVWLEVHNPESITLLAKNLPFEAYAEIKSRVALPSLFQLPAYLISYENGQLVMFKACDSFKLQTY